MSLQPKPPELTQFEQELVKIIQEMIKANQMVQLDFQKIQQLAQKTAATLKASKCLDNLQPWELKEDKTREALGLACKAQFVKEKNPNFKFDPSLLFINPEKMTPEQKKQLKLDKITNEDDLKDEFKKILKNEVKNLLKEICKYTLKPTPDMDKKLDALADMVVDKLMKKDNEPVCENANLCAFINGCTRTLDQLEEQHRELYGVGMQPGEVLVPVQAIPEGNKAGLLDMAFEGGKSYMSEQLCDNPGEPDPFGTHLLNLLSNLSTDKVTAENMEQTLVQEGLLPSDEPESRLRQTPRFVPPGAE